MPNITNTNEIQRNYRKVFETAKNSGPVVVIVKNKPDVIIISTDEYDKLCKIKQKWEIMEATNKLNKDK